MTNCPECGKQLIEIDPGSGKLHCGNPVCKFQFLDIRTDQKYWKPKLKKLIEGTHSLDDKIKKILVDLAIEKALFETGNISLYINVKELLSSDYDISIQDCMEHPKELRDALDKIAGTDTRNKVIKAIKGILQEFNYYKLVMDFLKQLED